MHIIYFIIIHYVNMYKKYIVIILPIIRCENWLHQKSNLYYDILLIHKKAIIINTFKFFLLYNH